MWGMSLVSGTAFQTDPILMFLQWKKKIEKQKAQALFKAAASIAQLSTQFNIDIIDGDTKKEAQPETVGVATQDNKRDAINEEDS
jgi:hypothetical protein